VFADGVTSGVRYRVHSNVDRIDVFPVDAELTFVSQFSIISPGSAPNAVYHQTVQIRLDGEGGGLIVRALNQFFECK
jgi:hypothetical protein